MTHNRTTPQSPGADVKGTPRKKPGIYARFFTPEQQDALAEARQADLLAEEIATLRVKIAGPPGQPKRRPQPHPASHVVPRPQGPQQGTRPVRLMKTGICFNTAECSWIRFVAAMRHRPYKAIAETGFSQLRRARITRVSSAMAGRKKPSSKRPPAPVATASPSGLSARLPACPRALPPASAQPPLARRAWACETLPSQNHGGNVMYEGLIAETVTIEGDGGTQIDAYFARPLGPGPHPRRDCGPPHARLGPGLQGDRPKDRRPGLRRHHAQPPPPHGPRHRCRDVYPRA